MKIMCLGGAGRICRETAADLALYSDFEQIAIADFDEKAGAQVVAAINDPRVTFVKTDVNNHADAVSKMRGFDVVADGTAISMNGKTSAIIAEAGCHAVNLNGFGDENAFADVFADKKLVFVPGFGMTPGVTQMMVMSAANQLDSVDTARISHGAYRPFAFSRSIAETTAYEYDPALPGRVVYEDGEFIQVPPFARPLEVVLPEPYGRTTQYIIPHAETLTVAAALRGKGVRLVETRGTWPPENMRLVRALYEYGILRNDKITVNGAVAGVMDCLCEYLLKSREGTTTGLYGYALHVEVTGERGGCRVRHTLNHTHPRSDGSVEGWEGLRAYTRNVGVPMSVAAQLIAKGRVLENRVGLLTPELAFDPADVFAELGRRGIHIHETIAPIPA
ncbi:MAG: saccharopine dehydrogenase NADP-binding domain-containing protein [Clostridiales Family XIII bacterium]|jgi:saccharopine dehydrogenase-like NADP-dependent oxidoreductase|nr:saccharopine dehydrogenase NADP-binding domain-containing protein [Clostridiales Family XIII bacterium]